MNVKANTKTNGRGRVLLLYLVSILFPIVIGFVMVILGVFVFLGKLRQEYDLECTRRIDLCKRYVQVRNQLEKLSSGLLIMDPEEWEGLIAECGSIAAQEESGRFLEKWAWDLWSARLS